MERTMYPSPVELAQGFSSLANEHVSSLSPHLAAAGAVGLIALQAFACLLVADFLSGLTHWAIDTYGRPEAPITGPLLTQPNIEHHTHPRALLRYSWADAMLMPISAAAIIINASWALGFWHWTIALTCVLAAFANQVHRWAHRSRTENGRVIVFLQQARIIQSPAQHAQHHRGEHDRGYCALSPWVNPIVDTLGLWRALEWLLQRLFNLQRRPDTPDSDHFPHDAHAHADRRKPPQFRTISS